MDINPFRPTDERGVPRRLRGHGEAFWWVARSLARAYGRRVIGGLVSAVVAWLAWSVSKPVFSDYAFDPFPPGSMFAMVIVTVSLLVIWLMISALAYVYIALAGGVRRRDEQ